MATMKITKREYFGAIKTFVNGGELAYPAEDVINFIDNEIDLLDRKASRSSSKPTKTQVENEKVKTAILDVLTNTKKAFTISEMMTTPELAGNSNQKLSALVKQLVDAGEVVRIMDKKKAYFSIPEPEGEAIAEDVVENDENESEDNSKN